MGSGDLPLTIFWQFNSILIEQNNKFDVFIQNQGNRVSVLTIESVKAHNAGKYTCFAKNMAGNANHTTALVVIGLSIY